MLALKGVFRNRDLGPARAVQQRQAVGFWPRCAAHTCATCTGQCAIVLKKAHRVCERAHTSRTYLLNMSQPLRTSILPSPAAPATHPLASPGLLKELVSETRPEWLTLFERGGTGSLAIEVTFDYHEGRLQGHRISTRRSGPRRPGRKRG